MKRMHLITGVLLLGIVLLTSCESLSVTRTKVEQQIDTAVKETSASLKNAKDQLNATKERLDQKVEDFQNAAEEVKEAKEQFDEAVDAVKNVTE